MQRDALLLATLTLLAGAASGGAPTFGDATDGAGIAFLHSGYDEEEPWFIEAVGSGACWGDVDHDGFDDLYLVNQRYVNGTGNEVYDPHHELYLNQGDGFFRALGAERGVDGRTFGTGCSFADVEGDGDLDLLVTSYGGLALFANDGEGHFTNLTARANLSLEGVCGDLPCMAMGTAWADYDRDGDLDVYLANYVDWHPELNDQGNSPGLYNGQPNVLFRNRGDGTFEDATAEAGVADDPGPTHSKSFQPLWFDHDADGWPDLYIASDTTPNTLFHNQRDGTFLDIATAVGADDPRSSMGLDIADWSADGRPDLFMTHYEGEYSGLYRQQEDGTYADHSEELASQLDAVGWGTGFHDFDADGDLDLYNVNGHTHPQYQTFESPTNYYERLGSSWVDRTSLTGDLQNATVSRGSAVADYDADGDLDLIQANAYNRSARLLRLESPGGHWLQVELRQPQPNTFAVGAHLEARLPDGVVLHRWVKAGNSFLSQDSLLVHIGLGTAEHADLRVTWPDGAVEEVRGVAHGQRVRWTRDRGLEPDTLAPRTSFRTEGPTGEAGWFRGPVTVALDAVERGLPATSGVAAVEARVGAGPWQAYEAPLVLSADGRHHVEAKARDGAGNQEPARSLEVRIDAVAPVTAAHLRGSLGEGGWYVSPVDVGLVAQDATSGVEATLLRIDDDAWSSAAGLRVTEDGAHVLEFTSRDRAGNAEAVQRLDLAIDRRAPTLHLAPFHVVGPWGGRVAVVAHDATSGLARVAYYLDGSAEPAAVMAGPHRQAWSPAPGAVPPGLHTLRVVAWDAAGHEADGEAWLLAL